jgi:hypothetical protein
MVLVAAALGLTMSLRHRDAAYALVLIWALIGIAVRLHETVPILVVSLAGAAALAVSLLVVARRERSNQRPNFHSNAASSSNNA